MYRAPYWDALKRAPTTTVTKIYWRARAGAAVGNW
jgi:hypothetical protein